MIDYNARYGIPIHIYILMSCFIGVKKIPTACITIEDAEMMARMAARGTKTIVNLKMEAQNLPPVISRNTVAEIKGSVYPEQVSAFQNLKSCLPFSFRLRQLAPIQHCFACSSPHKRLFLLNDSSGLLFLSNHLLFSVYKLFPRASITNLIPLVVKTIPRFVFCILTLQPPGPTLATKGIPKK